MQFGLYAPIPMATVGSSEIAHSASEALLPLVDGSRDAQFEHGLKLLQAADAAGFELALFAERHLGSDLSAWVLAGALASRLKFIRALVAVHPGLWDPVMTAKLAASLDRVSAGRMAVNIVNGWFDLEFKMFGGEVLQGEERYRRSVEFIEILRGLWGNDTFSYSGRYYVIDKAQLLLKPATAAPPEIFSVSTSDEGREFVAQTCDWWFVEMSKTAENTDDLLRSIEASIKDMSRRAAQIGRKLRYAINPFIALGPTTEEALQTTVERIFAYDPDADSRKIERRMLPATKAGCVGPPEVVLKNIQRFRDMGIELLLLKLIPTVENVHQIGAEIVSQFRRTS